MKSDEHMVALSFKESMDRKIMQGLKFPRPVGRHLVIDKEQLSGYVTVYWSDSPDSPLVRNAPEALWEEYLEALGRPAPNVEGLRLPWHASVMNELMGLPVVIKDGSNE